MRYLVVGDFHIPERVEKIPEIINKLAKEVDGIICTGDLISKDVLKELRGLNKNLIIVRGNCDLFSPGSLSDYREFEVNNKKIGVIHSDQFGRGNLEALKEFAKSKNLNVLVFGHTHKHLIKWEGNMLLLNPGTATGALSVRDISEKTYAILEIDERVDAVIKRIE